MIMLSKMVDFVSSSFTSVILFSEKRMCLNESVDRLHVFFYFFTVRICNFACLALILSVLMVSEFVHELGFTGIRCESGTVPAAVSPYAIVCLLHS